MSKSPGRHEKTAVSVDTAVFSYSSSLSTARKASVGICTVPSWRIFFFPCQASLVKPFGLKSYFTPHSGGSLSLAGRQENHSSSLSTARKASVGICTVPSWRIFFFPCQASLVKPFGLKSYFTPHSGGSLSLAGRQENHSSSLSTARKASVGICTVPSWRIFFLPSFCFSSSFFLRVMSPP